MNMNHEKNFFGIRSLGRYIGTDLHLHGFTTMVLCRCGLWKQRSRKEISACCWLSFSFVGFRGIRRSPFEQR